MHKAQVCERVTLADLDISIRACFEAVFSDFSENCRYNAKIFSLAPSALAQVLYILCGERAQKGHVCKGVVWQTLTYAPFFKCFETIMIDLPLIFW